MCAYDRPTSVHTSKHIFILLAFVYDMLFCCLWIVFMYLVIWKIHSKEWFMHVWLCIVINVCAHNLGLRFQFITEQVSVSVLIFSCFVCVLKITHQIESNKIRLQIFGFHSVLICFVFPIFIVICANVYHKRLFNYD